MYSIFCCSLFENIDPPVFDRLSSRMHLSLFPLPSRLSIDNNNTMNFILDSFLFFCAIILISLTNYCKVSLLPAMNSSGNWCQISMNLYLHKIFWGVRYKGVDKINFNHSVVLFIRRDGLQWLRSLWNNKSTFFPFPSYFIFSMHGLSNGNSSAPRSGCAFFHLLMLPRLFARKSRYSRNIQLVCNSKIS